jgi:hypothetical protein
LERRLTQQEADVELIRLRRKKAFLLRQEQEEQAEFRRAEVNKARAMAEREAAKQRAREIAQSEQARLDALRQYGDALAIAAPPEYRAKVARRLLVTVTVDRYPSDLNSNVAYAEVAAQVAEVLKPWHDREERLVRDTFRRSELIACGLAYARGETTHWSAFDSVVARRRSKRRYATMLRLAGRRRM